MNKKTIGIIGGMGPLATADLFERIISLTDAKKDADHIHILIDNYPQIPDRTSAILKGTESPVPFIVEAADRLAAAGADFLIIPCITSHGFYEEIVEKVRIPILNIVEETAKYLLKNSVSKCVLLATDGTRHTKVFDRIFEKYNIELFFPSSEAQNEVMDIIYKGIKAGKEHFDVSVINNELSKLSECGAKTVILGCTELPLAVEKYGLKGVFVNPTDVLAQAAIITAGYSVKA